MTDRSSVSRGERTQIYVCGAGIRVPAHLTVETMGVLQGCTRIFSMLPPFIGDLLPGPLRGRFENLRLLCQPDRTDHWAIDEIVDQILAAAIESSPVAYLAEGNPIMFDPVTQSLLARGRERDVAVEVRPAVSSIDTMLIDLQLDLAPGLQLYDATALVLGGIEPRVDIPCLLVQSSAMMPMEPATRGTALSRLSTLRDYLRRFYPASHEVALVSSASQMGQRAWLQRCALGDLPEAVDATDAHGAWLFLPAISSLAQEQQMFDRLLKHGVMSQMIRKPEFQA